MNKTLFALAALSLPHFALSTPAAAQLGPGPCEDSCSLEQRADAALEGDELAWDFVEGITTEVGPRQAGTEAEQRGREWAMAWLRAQGFTNVADEPFMMDTWVPGDTHEAEIVAPFAQPLVVQPLGNSATTGPEGITA
ncbi:MAG: peptidase M28 family protein, partial [Sphingomonadales bacterium CG12_big_fil_rev_8_21_14_0_65_65_10]